MTRLGQICSVLGVVGGLMLSTSVKAEYRFGFDHWRGQSFDSKDGNFSNCVVSLPNEDRNVLLIKLDRAFNLSVGAHNFAWNLKKGEITSAEIWFDHNLLYKEFVTSISKDFYFLNLVQATRSMNKMHGAKMALVQIGNQTILFKLKGITQALNSLVACVKHGRDEHSVT